MIDLAKEHVHPFAILIRQIPALQVGRLGRPTHPSTLARWASRGLRGIRLETIKVGGRTCSSSEALQRFFAALTEAGQDSPTVPSASIPLSKEARQAAEDLDELEI
jgi:Protein of unknown function (DUF1580)